MVVQGTTTGVVADFDGNYSISASVGDVLVFLCRLYCTRNYSGQPEYNRYSSTQSSNELEEVLVTGYGSQQQKEIILR